MNDTRKGQIAILFVKHLLQEKGIRLSPNLKREIGNDAKDIGVSFDEAIEFAEIIVRELVEETFPKTAKQ